MGFILRYLFGLFWIVAAFAVWWYPAPGVLRLTLVDWAERHEHQDKRFISISSTAFLPLTEFIAQKIDGRKHVVEDPEGLALLQTLRGEKTPKMLYLRPAKVPAAWIAPDIDYLELTTEDQILHWEARVFSPGDYFDMPIPSNIRYPVRNLWFIPLGMIVIGILIIRTIRLNRPLARCHTWTYVRIAAMIFALGCLGCFIAVVTLKSMGLVFLSGFIALAGLIGLPINRQQLGVVVRLVDGEDRLAHWLVDADDWRRFTEKVPRFLGQKQGDIYIGERGLLINRIVHPYGTWGSRLEAVELQEGDIPLLNISYSIQNMTTSGLPFRSRRTATVPVPPGQMEEGDRVMEQLKQNISN